MRARPSLVESEYSRSADGADQVAGAGVDSRLGIGRKRRRAPEPTGDGDIVLGVGRVEDGQRLGRRGAGGEGDGGHGTVLMRTEA
jgi:hypothetical protein